MTQLERADLHAGIETRYPDNTTEDITPKDLRDGLHELVDSVFVTATDTGAVPNVPEYKAGTFYVVGYTVRYTPVGGSEGFYAAKTVGKHTAPGPGNYIDWKVVPGPVTPTALSQDLTLSQAQGLDQAGVVAGREYLIDCGPDANGHQQTVTVRGVANEFYDVEGTLEVAGKRVAITDFNVQAGTWKVRQDSDFQHGTYTVQAADLPEPTITVVDAVAFSPQVGIVGTSGSLVTLAYGVGYTIAGNLLTILAAANAQAGEEVHYSYLPGSVQPSVTPTQLAAVATTLPLQAGQGANYTLRPDDIGTIVPFIGSQAMTLTIPTGLGLPAPAPGASAGAARVCYPLQYASGQLTLAAAPGVTLIAPPGQGLKSSGQGCRFVLIWLDSNIILVEGGI